MAEGSCAWSYSFTHPLFPTTHLHMYAQSPALDSSHSFCQAKSTSDCTWEKLGLTFLSFVFLPPPRERVPCTNSATAKNHASLPFPLCSNSTLFRPFVPFHIVARRCLMSAPVCLLSCSHVAADASSLLQREENPFPHSGPETEHTVGWMDAAIA